MTNTSVGCKWATTQYIDDYSVKINNRCVNYSSICRNFEIAAKIADFLHKCLFRLPNLHCSRFQAPSNRVIPHGVGKCLVVTKGLSPVRSWLWATWTDWGIKKQNTTYLKLIHPHKIPPSCLRQPTSLFKGGKKRIKRSRTFFLNSVNSYEIPPACLSEAHLPFQGRQKAD